CKYAPCGRRRGARQGDKPTPVGFVLAPLPSSARHDGACRRTPYGWMRAARGWAGARAPPWQRPTTTPDPSTPATPTSPPRARWPGGSAGLPASLAAIEYPRPQRPRRKTSRPLSPRPRRLIHARRPEGVGGGG